MGLSVSSIRQYEIFEGSGGAKTHFAAGQAFQLQSEGPPGAPPLQAAINFSRASTASSDRLEAVPKGK